jgi:hypothetical protein
MRSSKKQTSLLKHIQVTGMAKKSPALEPTPVPALEPAPARSAMKCTPEQQALVDLSIEPGRCVIVDAVPGAGKTSTCLERDMHLGGTRRVIFMYTLKATELAIENSAVGKSWAHTLKTPRRRLFTISAMAQTLVKSAAKAPILNDSECQIRLDALADIIVPLVHDLELCRSDSKKRGVTLVDEFGDRTSRNERIKNCIKRWVNQFDGSFSTTFGGTMARNYGWHAVAVQWVAKCVPPQVPSPEHAASFEKDIMDAWHQYASDTVAPLMEAWGLQRYLPPECAMDTAEAASQFIAQVLSEIMIGRPGPAYKDVIAECKTPMAMATAFDFCDAVLASRVLIENLFNLDVKLPCFFDFFTLKVSWFPQCAKWSNFDDVQEIIVDEAADISVHQRAMLHQFLARGKQVVALGDRRQQICQFSGTVNFVVDPGNLDNVHRLRLSVSFRLPVRVRNFAFKAGSQMPDTLIHLPCDVFDDTGPKQRHPSGTVVVSRASLSDVLLESIFHKSASSTTKPQTAAIIARKNTAVAEAIETVCSIASKAVVLLAGPMRADLHRALYPSDDDVAEMMKEKLLQENPDDNEDMSTAGRDRWKRFYWFLHFQSSGRVSSWRRWWHTERICEHNDKNKDKTPAVFVGNQYAVKGGEWHTVVVTSDVVNWRVAADTKTTADQNLEYVALTRSFDTQIIVLDVGTKRSDVHASYLDLLQEHMDGTGFLSAGAGAGAGAGY